MKIVAEKSNYHRFALYYEYSPDKVEFCRTLKDSFGWQRFSFESMGNLKRWVFSDSLFVPLFKEKYPEVDIAPDVLKIVEKEINWKLEEERTVTKATEVKKKKDTDFSIKGLKKDLYPYQKVGVEFLEASKGRAIIADAPGLGKTAQALAYIKHAGFKRTLVIAPASVKFSWEGEVGKWTRLSSVVIDSKTKLHQIDPDVNVWIINYDILKKFLPELLKTHFDCMIGDECQLIKSPSAIRTKAFRQISRNINSVILLSGTPLLSRPAELFSLLNIIDPKTWNNWYEYGRRYCAAHQSRWGWDVSGASHIEELHEKIKRYFIRRDKTEVLKELPPKTFIEVPVELDAEYSKQYDAAASNFAAYLREHSGKQPAAIAKTLQAEKLAQLNVLRLLNANGKLDTAIELIDSIIEAGEKVLVFCSFIEPLKKLEDRYGQKSVVLTGQTPIEERKHVVEQFQSDRNTQVFLGGIKSAGVGITLTAASNVLFLDYSWNPADHQQAQDRVHRPGQVASNVNIYQLFSMGSIDEDLKDILDHKQNVFDRVIEGKTSEQKAGNAMEAAMKRVLNKY